MSEHTNHGTASPVTRLTTFTTITTATAPMPAPTLLPVRLISFGYLFTDGQPPTAELTVDARRYLRDPAAMREGGLLDLDGRDLEVQRVFARTPGSAQLIRTIVDFARDFPAGHECVIAVGCAGGKHRSVAAVSMAAGPLMLAGREVLVEHRHVHLPRVLTAS